jgi:Tol biopolymer transport system component
MAATSLVLALPFAVTAGPAQATAAPAAGAPYVSVSHGRLADARIKPKGVLSFVVIGRSGTPVDGVSAVVLSVSVNSPASNGALVVYATGTKRPGVTSVSLAKAHASASDVVVVPGAAGKVSLYNGSSATQRVVVTARAYYAAAGTPKARNATAAFVRVAPRRLGSIAVKSGAASSLVVLGKVGIPKAGVAGVVVSLSVSAPSVSGTVATYAYGTKPPKQRTLSLHAGRSVTAAVVVKPGAQGRIAVANRSGKPVRVFVDVVGYLLTLHVPGVPMAVTATPRNASALVSWGPPKSNGGTPVSSYRVVTVPGGAVTTVPGNVTSASVGGLTNGTGYTFTVVAVNSRGAGPVSAPTAPVTPVTVPSAPTGVTVVAGGVGQAKLNWTASSDSGGSPIRGYQVLPSPAGGVTVVAGNTATVAGLSSGQYYTFAVTAINAVGSSPSAASAAVVVSGLSLASVTSAGTQGDGVSTESDISADGRYVAFSSAADNLANGDGNSAEDVFVRDRLTRTTTLVSVDAAGTGSGNGGSVEPSISADGRYVAFTSAAHNLVSPATTHADVFLRDVVLGTTTLVSQVGGVEGNFGSSAPSISADGSKIAFRSSANNLVSTFTSGANAVYLYDTAARTIAPVSATPTGAQAGGDSDSPSISADGRHVAFVSTGTDVVTSPPASGIEEVYERDMVTGTTAMVSAVGTSAQGDGFSGDAALSADGKYVAFDSRATNLVVGDTNTLPDVFVADSAHATVTRVDVGPHNTQVPDPGGGSADPAISADGLTVVFDSQSAALVPGDAGTYNQVFRVNVASLAVQEVSVSNDGAEGSGVSGTPRISADGQHVVFESAAGNLVTGDSNTAQDVVVADLG